MSGQPQATGGTVSRHRNPGRPALGVAWCFVYGYYGVPAVRFLPEVRRLGGAFTKVYLFWQQLEPEPGRYDWSALDAFADQLEAPEEGLVSLFSVSQWATRRPGALLPPSRARKLDDYYALVHGLVRRAAGRIRFWQNDAEPNNPVFWSGDAEEYVEQLRVFHRAVKDADPSAVVVLGGHDGMFVPPGMSPLPGQRTTPFPRQAEGLALFERILRGAGGCWDLFDLRLYGDPYTIDARVRHFRQLMESAGCLRPIICTEYGGPNFFEFPENRRFLPLIDAWAQQFGPRDEHGASAAGGDGAGQIAELYRQAEALPPQTRMFLQGCPAELEAKLLRIQSRQVVIRNVFARAAGVQRTLYWQLPVVPGPRDDLMTLMYGKIGLLRHDAGQWVENGPTAAVFRRLARFLDGAESMMRLPHDDASMFVFRIGLTTGGSRWVAWQRRDAFGGEDDPPVALTVACGPGLMSATTVFGCSVAVAAVAGGVRLHVSDTPVFLEPAGAASAAAPKDS